MVLKALKLPYDTEFVDFAEIKKEPYILVNPNGRVPSIEDPNTGVSLFLYHQTERIETDVVIKLTLWESGAIIQYLVSKYDPSNSISFPDGSDAFYQMVQWICFQISGQGPYFGQAAWFIMFHQEKLPSAISRYLKEIARVVSVIDLHLSRTKQKFLVADKENSEGKLTCADIIFMPWGAVAEQMESQFEEPLFGDGKNEAYQAWMKRVMAHPAVAEATEEKKAMTTKH